MMNGNLQEPGFDALLDTQTITCKFDPVIGSYWTEIVPCIPLSCTEDPPEIPKDANMTVYHSPDETLRILRSNISYMCPGDQTLHELIKDEYTFDFATDPDEFIDRVDVTCEINK